MSGLYQSIGRWLCIMAPVVLSACTTVSLETPTPKTTPKPDVVTKKNTLPAAGSGRGGYYKDDGPQEFDPPGLENVPDAVPTLEPYREANSRPYVVLGKTYTPITHERPFKQRGIGSWYGKKFHGQKTSSGEPYDMYQMTAAHPTLPIPSYARITNTRNGKTVIVRINDRGPFHASRIMDLSYTAALKLDYLSSGSTELILERITKDEIRTMQAAQNVNGPGVELGDVTTGSVAITPIATPAMGALPSSHVAASNGVSGTGFHLQLGAYSKEENARAAREQLMQSLSGIVTRLEVVSVNGLYRLVSPSFANRALAQAAADQAKQKGVNALVTEH
jgi:rare lipoprotein A